MAKIQLRDIPAIPTQPAMPGMEVFGTRWLSSHFAKYGPAVAGNGTTGVCYYLCLTTLDTLERFIVEMEG